MAKKLFRAILRDTNSGLSTDAYVVADDIIEACKKVLEDIERDGIAGMLDLILRTVELIAEDARRPQCGTRLYL